MAIRKQFSSVTKCSCSLFQCIHLVRRWPGRCRVRARSLWGVKADRLRLGDRVVVAVEIDGCAQGMSRVTEFALVLVTQTFVPSNPSAQGAPGVA